MLRQPLAMPLLLDRAWQMTLGERATIEGLLSAIRPQLAIEIGTAEGGALQRIAEHSAEVHAFDLVEPEARPDNVTVHLGDSHELLPGVLAELAAAGRNVDFVLVDGDHSAEGVERDVRDVLDSPAVAHAVVVIHDTANEEVRRGLDAIRFGAWPKVAYVELDCVPGHVFSESRLRHQLWGGIGIVLVDATRQAYDQGDVMQRRVYPAAALLADARDRLRERERDEQEPSHASEPRAEGDEVAELKAALDRQRRIQRDLERSISWRATAPLRALKRELAGRRHAG